MSKKTKIIIGLIIVALLGIGTLIVVKIVGNNKKNVVTTTTVNSSEVVTSTTNKQETPINYVEVKSGTPSKSTKEFSLEDQVGYVTVTGYAEVKKVVIDDPEEEVYLKDNYVYFHITKCDNADFMEYVKENELNTFFEKKAVGLGTYNNNKISYRNYFTDETGDYEYKYTFSKEDTKKIINSTKSKPITLRFDVSNVEYGTDAGDLTYSYMSIIEIVK